MKRNVSVVRLVVLNILISGKIIKELPGLAILKLRHE
jgi:hypothetical protein